MMGCNGGDNAKMVYSCNGLDEKMEYSLESALEVARGQKQSVDDDVQNSKGSDNRTGGSDQFICHLLRR